MAHDHDFCQNNYDGIPCEYPYCSCYDFEEYAYLEDDYLELVTEGEEIDFYKDDEV